MNIEDFKSKWPQRTMRAGGNDWGVIDTGGDGPVMVFLPGTLGTADIFWNQIADLSTTHRVVSLTYPALPDVVGLADGVAAVLKSLGVEKASILGSSLGGYMAQVFAARHGEMVETLFIANGLSDPDPFKATQPAPWLITLFPVGFLRKKMGERISTWSVARPELGPLVALLLEQLHHSIKGPALKARVLATLRGKEVPKVGIPDERIVIIESDDDPLIPATVRTDVKRRYPGAAVHTFEAGGHFPYVIEAERYTAILRQHLKS
jgi:pimeloyl-ACP methyl ester carboxylesterase